MKNQPLRLPEVHIIEDEPKVEAPRPERRPRFNRQRLLIRIGILLPLVLLAITVVRGAGETKYLPASLQGVWESSDPRYAGCFMELNQGFIFFDNAENGSLLYFVSSVDENHEGVRSTYLVHYTDLDGIKYQMTIVYAPKPHETLSFSHQPHVLWTRRPSE